MTDRERWIVYPLLFLALGLGLENELERQSQPHDSQTTDMELVRCKTLEIIGPEDKPTVKIGSDSTGSGAVEICDSDGKPQSKLGANPYGGTLEVLNDAGYLLTGRIENAVGLFAVETQTGQWRALSVRIIRPPAKESKSDAAEKIPAEKSDADKAAEEKPAAKKSAPDKAADGKAAPSAEKSAPSTKQESAK